MPIDKFIDSPNAKSALSGFLGGAAGGALISAFTNKKSAKKLLKSGGLVALGGLAYHAVQKYRDGQQPASEAQPVATSAPAVAAIAPPQPELLAEHAPLLLKAMVAAAHADGHLTAEEQTKIWRKAANDGLSGDALNALEQLLHNPPSIEEIRAEATDLDTRLEVYSASLLTLDEQCADGRAYLARLSAELQLPQPLVAVVHEQAAAA